MSQTTTNTLSLLLLSSTSLVLWSVWNGGIENFAIKTRCALVKIASFVIVPIWLLLFVCRCSGLPHMLFQLPHDVVVMQSPMSATFAVGCLGDGRHGCADEWRHPQEDVFWLLWFPTSGEGSIPAEENMHED